MHDLEKMVNIMETEYQLYNTLLDLSQKKTHAIANGKIKDLENWWRLKNTSYLS